MYLIVSSTEIEIDQLRKSKELERDFNFFTTNVGMVESAISLARLFAEKEVGGLILFGVGGAYSNTGVDILDICLAEKEYFGDLGVAMGNKVEYFTDDALKNKRTFNLKNNLLDKVENKLNVLKIPHKIGNFVTVNSCSGTLQRGNFLRDKFSAICENMEGAAVARVCELYRVPMIELRCVSNMVEDRDKSKWKLNEAIDKGTRVLKKLLPEVF
ncbi:futalosine hydrolase [Candidatus Oleimmundimicrobium sp.]|uniref:futalosine hydrolase n=1 Tax=Candidatus Oleimmundimicrobium sp. TaxID=3060597 RepID=UPI00271C4F1B|nr:futalosine hydrolase [Candidatus Oleimmundimicrobium sp.]MDO8885905.1 futalosine hydrolase [Candidatus Oleimmundimicrobium sp.]